MTYKRLNYLFILPVFILFLSGCASLNEKVSLSLNADQTAQSFFRNLEKSNRQDAYHLFGKGLSQVVSFDQFDQFIDSLEQHWGKIQEEQTVIMPFHQRKGERDFIPLSISEEQIKRYIFDVKFEHAEINFDLTIVPDGDQYKIVWLSLWGSSVYMTPEINDKIQELFTNPTESNS